MKLSDEATKLIAQIAALRYGASAVFHVTVGWGILGLGLTASGIVPMGHFLGRGGGVNAREIRDAAVGARYIGLITPRGP